MCGISGMLGAGVTREALDAMVAAQRHRGPDDQGTWLSPSGEVGLGHNRLSIIDLSAAGHQPMASADGVLQLVFNGEIYNYRELRAELPEHRFRGGSDTEVLLAAYQQWGEACVERFIGMFAFALWDAGRGRLWCARDRLGIKPFHYAMHAGRLVFASEIKALLAAGVPAAPDRQTWADYLVHGYYDHGERSFFDGVRALPPGHTLSCAPGAQPVLGQYWDLPALSQDLLELGDDEAGARLRAALDDSVRLRLRSDVPLGVNLSGGLDSASLIVSVDRLIEPGGEVRSFTASYDDPRYDEQDFAALVPRRHEWARYLQPLALDEVWALAGDALGYQEAPYGGIGVLGYHRLHRLARERGVTVLLEGQGVDELLGGYAYSMRHHWLDLWEAGDPEGARREMRAAGRDPAVEEPALARLRAGQAEATYQDGTSHLRPDCIAPELVAAAEEPPAFTRQRWFPDHLRNALYRDLRHIKLPRVLRMNDRLSMAFSRELREPYLDHRLVELAFRLPGHQKIRDGYGKWLLRHAMAERLPEAVRFTKKRAVVTPQREWLRGPLRPQVEALIGSASFAGRGLFDPARVAETFRRFCAGEGDNSFFVWQWISAELWFRRFIDGVC